MTVGGQRIDDKIIGRMQGIIDESAGEKRGALSRRICEVLKWRWRNGGFKKGGGRKIFLRFDRGGKIRLSDAEAFKGRRKRRMNFEQVPAEAVKTAALEDIQPVELVLVGSAEGEVSRTWNDLMDRYHYLGSGPLCGAQLRYLIRSEKHGYMGAMSFSGAA